MRRSPERRQQVLDEANRLIAEGGLPRLSMLELAQRLAMSKETLYAWFGSKDALLAELVGSNAAQAMAGLQRALERRTGSATALRAALREFCRELLQLLMSERSVALNRGAVHMAHTGSGRCCAARGGTRCWRSCPVCWHRLPAMVCWGVIARMPWQRC